MTDRASKSRSSNIKDFAKTAMNELLGWYGYGPRPKSSPCSSPSPALRPVSPSPRRILESQDSESSLDSNPLQTMHVTPDRESSECSSPAESNGTSATTSATPGITSGIILCAWCGRVCSESKVLPSPEKDTEGGRGTFQLATTSGDRFFCSERCFSQCRRASFKKSKVCDWCRQVKPTVTYVDFTDGDRQLQFCSDKCLNQYKMQIFCNETKTQMELHPHLNKIRPNSTSALITPELWFKNCANGSPEQLASPISHNNEQKDSEPVNLAIQKDRWNDIPRKEEIVKRKKMTRQLRVRSSKLQRSNTNEGTMRGSIRVRNLTESSNSEFSPVAQPLENNIAELANFERLLTAHHGIVPGLNTILSNPSPYPHDITRNPLVPHLLIGGPDICRFPGTPLSAVRQSIPSILPRLPSQPPPPPPPAPILFPQTNLKPMPPVTVLLPFPFPLPIPIPIPLPIPIPIPVNIEASSSQNNATEPNSASITKSQISSQPNAGTATERETNLSLTSLREAEDETPASLENGHGFRTERERRSILRYTSDVYEINGIFVPRGGSWDCTNPQESSSTKLKEEKQKDCTSHVSSATVSKSSEVISKDVKKPTESSKKRKGEISQPLPKKKHLIT